METNDGRAFLDTQYREYFRLVKEIDQERLKTEKASELFEIQTRAFESFGIVWGYYLLLDTESGKIFHYPNNNENDPLKEDFNPLPYGKAVLTDEQQKADVLNRKNELNEEQKRDFYKQLKELENDFTQCIASKKYHIDGQGNQKSHEFLNLPSVTGVKSNNGADVHQKLEHYSFKVILSDEILFHIFLDSKFEEKHIWDYTVQNQTHNEILVNLIQLLNYMNYVIESHYLSGSMSEFRKEELVSIINEIKKPILVGDQTVIFDKIIEFFNKEIEGIVKQRNDLKIRFNIDLSLKLAEKANGEVFDFFIFPMVTLSKRENEAENKLLFYESKIKNFDDENIVIKQPLLLCAYIEPIYKLTSPSAKDKSNKLSFQLFENPETLDGFKATEMLCEHLSKTVVDSIFYGKLINKARAKELVKSQKAAIMGRNMSHNIGSHVLYYLKKSLSNREAIFSNKVLHDWVKLKDGEYTFDHDQQLPFLYGLGRFINYLQERQDFIATISTEYIPSMSQINFKDSIFDEINYDLAALRHKGNDTLLKNNIVLENIAKSENYNRGKIQIAFGKDIGLGLLNEEHTGANEYNWELEKDWQIDRMRLKDYAIDVPSGTVGRQAFFSVVENILRNSCKHGSGKDIIRLTIDMVDLLTEQSTEVKNYYFNKFSNINNIEENYYICTIHDNVANNPSIIDLLQKSLIDPLIDENTLTSNQKYKGLKEIKISSSWIIGKSYDDNDLSHIFIDGKKNGNDLINIRYNFLLRKPKEFIYMHRGFIPKDVNEKSNNFYNMIAFELMTEKELIDVDSNLDYTLYKSIVYKWLGNNTNRSIIINDVRLLDHEFSKLEEVKKKKLFEFSYEKWLQKIGINKFKIVIEDSKSLGANKFIYTYGDSKKEIVIRDHLDTGLQKKQFLKDYNITSSDSKVEFAESITGNNSSKTWYRDDLVENILERLNIRGDQEKLRIDHYTTHYVNSDLKIWTMKTAEAARMNVAILDERIISDNQFIPECNTIQEIVNITYAKLFDHYNIHDLEEDEEALLYDAEYLDILQMKYENLNLKVKVRSASFRRSLISLFSGELSLCDPNKYMLKHFISSEKFIDLFNSVSNNDVDFKRLNNIYYYNILKSAQLIVDNHQKIVGKFEYDKVEKKLHVHLDRDFHFISIHQGLLDKMFIDENLKGIRGEYEVCYYGLANKKISLINQFVHSGRSKPPNLPSNVGFLLFSQVEHCMSDKKKTIIDLFFNTTVE